MGVAKGSMVLGGEKAYIVNVDLGRISLRSVFVVAFVSFSYIFNGFDVVAD